MVGDRTQASILTVDELLDHVTADYAAKGLRSAKTVGYSLQHLRDYFGGHRRSGVITTVRVNEYVAFRRQQGAAHNTIRIEVHLLARAFRLAVRSRRLPERLQPRIDNLPPDNSTVREGFVTREEMEAICAHLPKDYADVVEFLFHSGWRIGEARKLQWSSWDRTTRAFRLRAADSKTKRPRFLPCAGLLEPVIERRLAARVLGCPWVFHRPAGNKNSPRRAPIGDFRKRWHAAVEEASLEAERRRLPHDLRRSAAKFMVEAGLDPRRAMGFTGHTTMAVFHRYQIVSPDSMREAAELVAANGARRSDSARKANGR
ncbi:site-specific integrase [Candidatus Binatia bacterium]|nr:site-specific integrase [Candidatus Binatia bacterium]